VLPEFSAVAAGRYSDFAAPIITNPNTPAARLCKMLCIDEVATGSYFLHVRSVGLKVLKNRLSEYVRLASAGETVLVTDRDRVVAELGPPREHRSPLLADAAIAEAVRSGWLTPPVFAASDAPPALPVAPLDELLQELEADRAAR